MVNSNAGIAPILKTLVFLWIAGLLFFFLLTNLDLILGEIDQKLGAILLTLSFLIIILATLCVWLYQNSDWKLSELKSGYERELESERNKRFHAQKLQSLGRLSAGIAHEINNPLAIIGARNTQLGKRLKELKIFDSDLIRFVEIIDKQVNRVAVIIKSLQQLTLDTQREALSPSRPLAALKTTLEYLETRPGFSNVTFSIDDVPPDLEVMSRPAELIQILYNLLGNSIDATISQEKPWIKVLIRESDKMVSIIIQDSGKPLSENLVNQIFEPFYTTKEVGQGTGLGLSLCRQMAENQGGSLEYDFSYPNTSFCLTLVRLETSS